MKNSNVKLDVMNRCMNPLLGYRLVLAMTCLTSRPSSVHGRTALSDSPNPTLNVSGESELWLLQESKTSEADVCSDQELVQSLPLSSDICLPSFRLITQRAENR